ncbi:MAG: hypothetical protein LBV59_26190 [Sphingobacterium sp.]|jgi:O-antigen/teichoic acid export membrane protein|uniref:lipopolysaccharide biosynthesis protein n=1 Tax=Sphingobacterium sp. TaxID=341027 RepID=UPI002850AE06|nr:hypothetical protein [Sphingobacterium sp.]MDR3011438.1 hypothetical protein [Sphingobacterium sp.]
MSHRTSRLKNNISYSLLFKGLSVLATLALVPITLKFVNKDQYGLWLVLSSIIGWFNFFDIGLGNGLKTKLTESLTDGDVVKAKKYVSTTYLLLLCISLGLFLLFIIGQFFVSWQDILNAHFMTESELKRVAFLIFFSFTFQFVLNTIVTVAAANQNTIIGSIVNLLINCLSLVVIFLLTVYVKTGTLEMLAIPMALSPVLILFSANYFLFKGRYKVIAPNYSFFDSTLLKDIFQLGWKFFIIQLGLILVYNIDNLIITQLFGPDAVTTYNISYRYFSIITMLSGIVMAPLWTAFGEAYRIEDHTWIKSTIKKMQMLVLGLGILACIMAVSSRFAYKLWLGMEIDSPILLSWVLALYTVLNAFRTIYIYYLNGLGIISLQVILVVVVGILNIPLGIFFGHWIGLAGVVLATLILSIISAVIEFVQYQKIVAGTARGIWKK